MGGRGSTRWGGYVPKPLVEDALCLDLADLRRAGALSRPTAAGTIEWRGKNRGDFCHAAARFVVGPVFGGARRLDVVFSRAPDEPQNLAKNLTLESYAPNFGGVRWFFRCPECERRVAKLYLAADPGRIGCRRCLGLQYRSAREHDSRIDRLRRDPEALLAALQAPPTPSGFHRMVLALRALDRGVPWMPATRGRTS